MTSLQFQACFHVFSGNGIIEFPEFVDLMSRRPMGHLGSEEELRGALRDAFDHNKDGHLDVKEFRRAMKSMGEALTDEQMDEMLKDFEGDGDGMVRYEGEVLMLVFYLGTKFHVVRLHTQM